MTDRIGTITIRSPIWSKRAVGVNKARVNSHDILKVRISYRDRSGNFPFPGVYTITTKKARTFPTQTTRGICLYIIPIDEMELG